MKDLSMNSIRRSIPLIDDFMNVVGGIKHQP